MTPFHGETLGEVVADSQSEVIYDVVVNDEDQYSIWRLGRDIPDGWRAVGFSGSKADCLAHVEEIWTDMRPKSLRERMARADSA